MRKNLLIVESPAKAKTIAKFLGKEYEIKSSFGHIRDLPKKGLGVDIEHHFEPTYEIPPDKQAVVKALKRAASGTTVWLASDEDREGEAIAWHVCNVLGIDPTKTNRIVFHEITKQAITKAVAKPRTINMKLVHAQQARRILDRLVGYELSPVLWKKVKSGLSAGRVQSVAVRLIVEREREIKAFKPRSSFKVSALFEAGKNDLPAELNTPMPDEAAARKFLKDSAGAEFRVSSIEQKPGTRTPSAPFITSTLQQEAARRLGLSVRQTMTLAQKLYENGHITYMRTDSTSLSSLAIEAAKKYIVNNFGEIYSRSWQYQIRVPGAQEAHEAIRPTHLTKLSAGADAGQKKLYELIWRRMLASQMSPAKFEKTHITISVSKRPEVFTSTGEVLVFDGFFKVYGGGKDDLILPAVEEGQDLKLQSMNALQSFARQPPRYGEAALVKKLEELGIGRPSTYAPTISTIQEREYVEKKDLEGRLQTIRQLVLQKGTIKAGEREITVGADHSKLVPTTLAEIVTDFLLKYFESIMDYDFTATAEGSFDQIAEGQHSWQEVLENFYKHFHPLVEKAEEADRAAALRVRVLGKDPKTGSPISARYGRFGPVLQLGETPKQKNDKSEVADKPRFAPLPTGVSLEEVGLEQALPMFNLPREVGQMSDGSLITADIGRFGPYVKVNDDFVSIKDYNPFTITEKQARQLIAEKRKAAKARVINDFGSIKVLKGRYGPYVTDGKKNVSVPKTQKPQALTALAAAKLLKDTSVKKSPAWRGRAPKAQSSK